MEATQHKACKLMHNGDE
jgi:hypothetical protein